MKKKYMNFYRYLQSIQWHYKVFKYSRMQKTTAEFKKKILLSHNYVICNFSVVKDETLAFLKYN